MDVMEKRGCLFDKLVDVLHEEVPVVVHQQVQIDPLPSENVMPVVRVVPTAKD